MKSQVLKVANKLRARGYQVSVYKRKDGGYLITKINNQRFYGASGNARARTLTNTKLTSSYRSVIQANKGVTLKHMAKHPTLPKRFMKLYRRVQSAWRINPPDVKGKIRLGGEYGYRAKISEEGLKTAMERLQEQYRYAHHIAYTENIKAFGERLDKNFKYPNKRQAKMIKRIKSYLKKHKNDLKQEKLEKAFEYTYKDSKGKIDEEGISYDTPLERVCKLFDIDIKDL